MKSITFKIFFILFSLTFLVGFPEISNSQDGRSKIISALTPVVKFSTAGFINNAYHPLNVYGIKDDLEILIDTFQPSDTFKLVVKDYDKLKFFSRWKLEDGGWYSVNYFLDVAENQKFEFFPVPVFKLKGVDIEVSNSTLKRLAGNKLYEVTIKDDVNSSAVEVFPLESSSPYIDVIRIDTVTYQIMLKNKDEFIGNLTDAQIKSWSKGEELSFPIGILMIDRSVPDDEQTYQLYLKKKKKAKKKTA